MSVSKSKGEQGSLLVRQLAKYGTRGGTRGASSRGGRQRRPSRRSIVARPRGTAVGKNKNEQRSLLIRPLAKYGVERRNHRERQAETAKHAAKRKKAKEDTAQKENEQNLTKAELVQARAKVSRLSAWAAAAKRDEVAEAELLEKLQCAESQICAGKIQKAKLVEQLAKSKIRQQEILADYVDRKDLAEVAAHFRKEKVPPPTYCRRVRARSDKAQTDGVASRECQLQPEASAAEDAEDAGSIWVS